MNQPLGGEDLTMDSLLDSAALTQPDQTESVNVVSELFFDKPANITEVLGQTTPVVNVSVSQPQIDVPLIQQTSPGTFESITNSITQINNNTEQTNESVKITSELTSDLMTKYNESVVNNNQAVTNLQNMDTFLKTVSADQISSQSSIVQDNSESTLSVENDALQQFALANDTMSRLESNQLISKSETQQLIKPANPVVSSIEGLSQIFSRNIQDMSSTLSSNISNIKTGGTVSNSQVTNMDQSSVLNQQMAETQRIAQEDVKKNTESTAITSSQSEMFLAQIYELLIAGIKVKLNY